MNFEKIRNGKVRGYADMPKKFKREKIVNTVVSESFIKQSNKKVIFVTEEIDIFEGDTNYAIAYVREMRDTKRLTVLSFNDFLIGFKREEVSNYKWLTGYNKPRIVFRDPNDAMERKPMFDEEVAYNDYGEKIAYNFMSTDGYEVCVIETKDFVSKHLNLDDLDELESKANELGISYKLDKTNKKSVKTLKFLVKKRLEDLS